MNFLERWWEYRLEQSVKIRRHVARAISKVLKCAYSLMRNPHLGKRGTCKITIRTDNRTFLKAGGWARNPNMPPPLLFPKSEGHTGKGLESQRKLTRPEFPERGHGNPTKQNWVSFHKNKVPKNPHTQITMVALTQLSWSYRELGERRQEWLSVSSSNLLYQRQRQTPKEARPPLGDAMILRFITPKITWVFKVDKFI